MSALDVHVSAAPAQRAASRPILAVILTAAVIVTVLRILAPFQPGYDQSIQMEAAQRFAAGNGITTTKSLSEDTDIMTPPKPRTVTWWPPGFSVVLGALLAVGMPLVVALKLMFSCVTIAGWLGWGVIAQRCLDPLHWVLRRFPLHLVFACCCPFFLTPKWSRSDIFLWAGVPLIILLLARRPRDGGWRFDAAAGCLLGALIGFRYAAAFLAPVAALMLIQYSWPDWKAILRRGAVFSVAALILVAPLVWFMMTAQSGAMEPPELRGSDRNTLDEASLSTTVRWLMMQSPAVWNLLPGLWLLASFAARPEPGALNYMLGAAGLLLVVALPFACRWVWRKDLGLSLSFIPIALILFLAALYKGLFLSTKRYYDPAVPAVLILIWAIAAGLRTPRIVRFTGMGLAGIVTVYLVALAFAFVVPGARRSRMIETVMGYIPARQPGRITTSMPVTYPSPGLLYGPREATRRKMFELHRASPDALFFVRHYPVFAYDSALHGNAPVPGEHMREFPGSEYWGTAGTSRPVRVFWVVDSASQLAMLAESKQRVVYEDPWEQSKIIVTDLPAGYRFQSAPPHAASGGVQEE